MHKFQIFFSGFFKNIPTFIAVISLMLIAIYMFYPGVVNEDTANQLMQARAFMFTDWHPPVMSYLWVFLNHFYDGFQSMLVFHNLMFWSALLILGFLIFPNSNLCRIILIAFFGFFPTVLVQLGTVFKDSSMSISLFMASVLLLCAERRSRDMLEPKFDLIFLFTIGAAIFFLFYGFAVRLNSAPAVVVLCIWLGDIVIRKGFLRSVLIGTVLFSSLFIGTQIITDSVIKPVKTFPFQQVQAHDLAAISLYEKKELFPEYVLQNSNFSIEKIQTFYTPLNVGDLIFYSKAAIKLTNNIGDIKELNTVWLKAIYEHPWSYLKHRAKVFRCATLGCIAFWSDICRISLADINSKTNIIYNSYCSLTLYGPLSFLFHSWIYIVNSLFIGIIAIWKRKQFINSKSIIYLISSSMLYFSGLFFYAPACEFRYVYWVVIASFVALILFIENIFSERSMSRPDTGNL